jgi:stage V sporulation protein SpoVS
MRVADYGDIAKVPAKMFEAFRQRFASADAPDPHDVAAAIAKVIAMPKGGRPARVVVGQAFGADAVNDAVAPIQRQVIETLGLGPLALKPVEQ